MNRNKGLFDVKSYKLDLDDLGVILLFIIAIAMASLYNVVTLITIITRVKYLCIVI